MHWRSSQLGIGTAFAIGKGSIVTTEAAEVVSDASHDLNAETSVSLSVVIPVYNEEDTIGTCLGLLVDQIDHIAEIVVVDNNSTDETRAVVNGYIADFPQIRIVDESEQGLVYARNAGMNAATSDVIARIDSDTRVPEGWAARIVEFFTADADTEWAALCGRGAANGLPFEGAGKKLARRLEPVTRAIARLRSGDQTDTDEPREIPVLYGSNMILRRTTWQQISARVSMRRDIFEDVDMGLCVQDIGGRNAFLGSLTVGVSPRRMETSLPAFVEYMSFLPRTLLLHRRYRLAALVIFGYLPAVIVVHAGRLVLIRAHDPATSTFSVRNLTRKPDERGLP